MGDIIKLTPVYDRSRVVSDWACPRKRFWNYEYEGKGIVRSSSSLELFTGVIIHDALAEIALTHPNVDIDAIAMKLHDDMFAELERATKGEVGSLDFCHEQSTLVEGMIRAFYKHVWPTYMDETDEILFIEKEMLYPHGGLTFMSKGDLILKLKDGGVTYVEYKTTRSKREEWITSWDTAVQLHSTIKAVEATTGVVIDTIIVQGLYKGYESYGKQSSPFCYAYKKFGNPPFTKDQISYDYKSGFKRFPTWELEGGVKKWVDDMPSNVLSDQFPRTPPIFINDDLVAAFFRQREQRENEIELAMDGIKMMTREGKGVQHILDETFPQRFDQCQPSYGRPCEYRKLCHGPAVDPMTQGFTWREPHHQLELDQQGDVDAKS